MKALKKLLVVLVMLCSTQAFAEVEQGRDYQLLSPPQPTSSGKKIEVLEFFFYGCPHCFHLHPFLAAWEKKMPKDVELTYVPTVFRAEWEPMANTFYALEMLGKQKELHDALFHAWDDNIILTEEDKIADFVAQHGVNRQKFIDLYNSFSVQSKVTRAKQMVLSYHITGTPTLVVDGRYAIVNKQNAADTIRTLDEVIALARREHAGKR